MTTPNQTEPECAIPFDSKSQRVFLHLWRTYDILRSIEDECLSDFGVSAQQYNVLRILRATHPEAMPTMQLSRKMVSRGPDITRMLDRLSKYKWIRRARPRSNRRVVEVGITDTGLALLAEMDTAIIQMHERQFGHLKSKEKTQLIELLKIVRRPHEDDREGWLA